MKNLKILFLILPLFATILLGCGLFENQEDTSVKDPSQLEQGEKITLTGKVSFYMDGDYFFTLEDTDQSYTIFISESENIVTGDYIKVQGIWDTEINGLDSEGIKKLSEEEKISYFQSRFPFLEIEILGYSQTVGHTCDTPKFELKLTNTGATTVTHKDLHEYYYDYGFYYFVGENWSRANADRANYSEVEAQIKEDELGLIGLLSNQGFMYFEDIEPGQSIETEYWAGGQVSKTQGGTAGSPNIFDNYSVGEFEVSFAWAKHNNYDPIFLYKTEPVKVSLLSDKCDLGL